MSFAPDWSMVAVFLTGFIGLGGGVSWAINRVDNNVGKAVKGVADDIVEIKHDMGIRVDRLEQSTRDFRTGASIDSDIDHAKRNVMQTVTGLTNIITGHTAELVILRERSAKLETSVELQNRSYAEDRAEMREDMKEVRREMNARFDQMTITQKDQFDQLCASIREISTRSPKA